MREIRQDSKATANTMNDALRLMFIALLTFFLLVPKENSGKSESQRRDISNDRIENVNKPLVNLLIHPNGTFELITSGSHTQHHKLNSIHKSFRSVINTLEKESLKGVVVSATGDMLYSSVKEIKLKMMKEMPKTTIVLN